MKSIDNDEKCFYKSLIKLYEDSTLNLRDLVNYWRNGRKKPTDCTECPFSKYFIMEQFNEIELDCKLNEEIETSSYEIPINCPFMVK